MLIIRIEDFEITPNIHHGRQKEVLLSIGREMFGYMWLKKTIYCSEKTNKWKKGTKRALKPLFGPDLDLMMRSMENREATEYA